MAPQPLWRRHATIACSADFHRAYYREVDPTRPRGLGRPKWIAFGYFCKGCGVTVLDSELKEETNDIRAPEGNPV